MVEEYESGLGREGIRVYVWPILSLSHRHDPLLSSYILVLYLIAGEASGSQPRNSGPASDSPALIPLG